MDIKFVSYDGEYPNLCSGQLILEIDGKQVKFNNKFGTYSGTEEYPTYEDLKKSYDYPKFWTTGGCIKNDGQWNMWAEAGPWLINEDELPDHLKPYRDEISKIFNANVIHGCCGGCI